MAAIDELRILSPTGVCGSGFLEASFEKALAWEPHFIGCDAGSTRPAIQGDLDDSDGHGGEQYAPLMDIEIP